MNTTTAAVLMIATIVAVLAIVHVPFGDYMARVYTGPRHLRAGRRRRFAAAQLLLRPAAA